MKRICKKEFGEKNWKVYDIKFLSILSIVFLITMVVMTLLYPFIIVRYVIIVAIMFILFLKRKLIVEKIKKFVKGKKEGLWEC